MAIHNFTFSPACAEHERAALRRLGYRLIWRDGAYILRTAFGSTGVQLVQYHTREVRL